MTYPRKFIHYTALLLSALLLSFAAKATVVEVRTVVGDFQINLFDEDTPQTVQNFLDYVNSGAYANNVVHRSVSGFIVQAGGFEYNGTVTTDGSPPLDNVPTGASVTNEPELSNVRGTIAMAKIGGQPNSATSQWFINLDNNSANLDTQNAGFTVFGQVLGNGMQVVDAISAIQTFNFGGALTDLPLRNFSSTNTTVTDDNLVIITDIVVIDAATVTNPDLTPVRNTLINAPTPPPDNSGDSSGGSIGVWLLLLAFAIRVVPLRR